MAAGWYRGVTSGHERRAVLSIGMSGDARAVCVVGGTLYMGTMGLVWANPLAMYVGDSIV